jgi:hypothetical protein
MRGGYEKTMREKMNEKSFKLNTRLLKVGEDEEDTAKETDANKDLDKATDNEDAAI